MLSHRVHPSGRGPPYQCARTVGDRYGPNLTEQEYMQCIDDEFLITPEHHLQYLTTSGKFSVRRNYHNDRGDCGNVEQNKTSMEEVGMVNEAALSAFLLQGPDAGVDDEFEGTHWMTRLEGLDAARLDLANATNRRVLNSMATGLRGCKLYRRAMHSAPACCVFQKLLVTS